MEKKPLYYSKVRSVKSPARGDSEASGIDLFVPEFTDTFLEDLKKKNPDISSVIPGSYQYIVDLSNTPRILLAPHARICIPSGIKFLGTPGVSINMHNKSGIGTKKGLNYLAEVVDSNYQGEVHISVENTSPFIVEICEGEKIIQVLQEPAVMDEPTEVPEDTLFAGVTSERGENWQGSTGTK